MKKLLIVALCAALGVVGLTGCTKEDKAFTANTSGQLIAATWLAAEKPDTAAVDAVEDVLSQIAASTDAVADGATFTAALGPIVTTYLANEDVDPAYVPLIIAGTGTILNGIDLLFARNPDWLEDQAEAIAIANAFITGANTVFALQPDSREFKAIMDQADELDAAEKALLDDVIITSEAACTCVECATMASA